MTVDLGAIAPPFTLSGITGAGTSDEERRDFSLVEFLGTPVVLAFYPGDNTPVCTRQLNAYTNDIGEFDALDAHILAISPQDVDSHASFSCKQGTFAFPLLADTDKAVGAEYGVVGLGGIYRRSVFVVSSEGLVTYAHRSLVGATYRPTTQLIEALKAG